MTGHLYVIGLGPGDVQFRTGEAEAALADVAHVFGYKPYVARVAARAGLTRHASDNREEIDRAAAALTLAAAGEKVALVSGGDPGVFAMAAAACEAVEHGPAPWRTVPLTVVPGITAMLALAARVGAPLGHDFCAISLSDNLKPWDVIEMRLRAAARAGFAMAFYNPVSRARPWQLGRALDILREELPPTVPVIFGRAVTRPDEAIAIVPLADAISDMADMATCPIVGTAETRLVPRPDLPPLIYTPRTLAPAKVTP
ncbi:precorrin-3B C(17)-methyltransferase [Acuticoccus sp. MNP-M23]|uniref:precorrin-3B C(17)-methyltransferase n=1 Tax=Acuticoccus sp. MNP-M23 TaxID=3072793 RepID=UPI0028156517|nr:precorrin-3B C(17)-methyltransferase [Acuticoccus sp. MNP-M23]WMS43279.1 precorrin-3B C(17)-methyltransferase [Acuticoccus sp. MNP-M23]